MNSKTSSEYLSPLIESFAKAVASPLRKSQLNNTNNRINLLQHDDNAERVQRRSLIGNKVDIPELNGKVKIGEQQIIQDHFQLCVKLFLENKINTKNVWNLKAIDYMEAVLQSQLSNKNFLQIGGTSLDVCSKVYGIRVDDLYASGIQLAGNIARSDIKSTENGNLEEKKENGDKRRNKKKLRNMKSTVVKDLKSITGNIPKLNLNHFQNRLGIDTGNTSLLYTNILKLHPFSYRFLLISRQMHWLTYSNLLPKSTHDSNRLYIWPLRSSERKLIICKALVDFEINRWNPDENDSFMMQQSFGNIIFDEKGLPIAELDGSVHDSFNIKNCGESQDEDDNYEVQYKIYNEPLHILTFEPEDDTTVCNEYSYAHCNSVKSNNKNIITQMWAGPSHWKLKYIRPVVGNFSGADQKQKNGKRKDKAIHSALDFFDCPTLSTVKYRSKKTACIQNSCKLTLPENHVQKTFIDFGIKLASKPLVIFPKNSSKMSTDLEDDLPFNYKNPNDSEYCCENNLEQTSFESKREENITHEGQNEYHENVEQLEKNENFIAENLISRPQTVQKSFVPFAPMAKKLDIRQLKNAVRKCIESEDINSLVKENMRENKETQILFSDIYKRVPNFISKEMKKELSLPITFVAFLHLVNEHNLEIETYKNYLTDFKVKTK